MPHSPSKAPRKVATSPEQPPDEQTDRIVQAARRHFFLHGFRGVTMDDLAAELGMSKKTLYACFESKTALLQAVLRAKMADVEADLTQIGADPRGDHSKALEELLACVQRHGGEVQAAFIRDVRRETPELFEMVEKGRRAIMKKHFTRILEQGRRSGVIREDISVELVIEILLAAVDAIVNPTRMEELRLSPKDGYAAILRVVLEGVLKPKARARK